MKDGKIQGIGFIVAIIFTFIMLTAGRVPTIEEQEMAKEQKAEQALREQHKETIKKKNYRYRTVISSVFTEDGTSVISISDQKDWFGSSDNFELKETPLRSGDSLDLNFLIVKDVRDSEYADTVYDGITQEEFDNIDFELVEFKTNREEVSLVDPKNIEFDEDESVISVNVRVEFENHISYVYPENGMDFEMITVNDKFLAKVDNIRYLFKIEKSTERPEPKEDGRVMGQGNTSAKESSPDTSWTKETYTEGEDTTIPLNDGNIEDWDHILDEDQIEDGVAADGEGIYD